MPADTEQEAHSGQVSQTLTFDYIYNLIKTHR